MRLHAALLAATFSLYALTTTALAAESAHSPDGKPWPVAATGVTPIEAEDFDNGGEGVAYHDRDNVNHGGKYRPKEGVSIQGPNRECGETYNIGWIEPGNWLNYTIDVAQAGTYQIVVRASNANRKPATVHISVGDHKSAPLSITHTDGWGAYTNFTTTLDLQAGVQTIRLTTDDGGYNLDYISLQPAGETGGEQAYGVRGLPPRIPPYGQAKIEAENYDLGGEGVAYHKQNQNKIATANFNGGKFRKDDLVSTTNEATGVVVAHWEPTDWLQYTVTAADAGSYELLVNYSRGDQNSSDLAVSVNGAGAGKIDLPSTGGWGDYKSTGIVVKLNQGTNRIRLTTSVGQLNLDFFRLIEATTFGNNGAPWSLAGTGTTHIEAENYDATPDGAHIAAPSSSNTYRTGPATLEKTTDTTGGFDVINLQPHDNLNYTVQADLTGSYSAAIRVLAPRGGTITLATDHGASFDPAKNPAVLASTLAIPASASWQTVTVTTKILSGLQTLRVSLDAPNARLNALDISKITQTPAVLADPNEKGSYAAEPPDEALNRVGDLFERVYLKKYDWINRPAGAAIPTNDWWTQILEAPFAANMWAYPERISDSADGLGFTLVDHVKITPGDVGAAPGQELIITDAAGTPFTRDALLDYADWTVHYRMEQAGPNYIDVTIGRGLPFMWCEFQGIRPVLGTAPDATVHSVDGATIDDHTTGDSLRIDSNGKSIGIFAPPGTTFTHTNGKWSVTFVGAQKYLVIAALPDNTKETFALFAQHAYAIPRTVGDQAASTFTYAYDATAGTLKSTWSLHTEPLKPNASQDTLMGWLPQLYEEATTHPDLIPNVAYPCIEGTIKLAVGHQFQFTQPAANLPFALPAPKSIGGIADYSPDQMTKYIKAFIADRTDKDQSTAAGKPVLKYGGDTYWGGKQPQEYAEWALLCKSIGDDADYHILLDNLRAIMTDWFTYTPGEKEHFFTYYPDTGALIGLSPSYGSENFTDNMFHDGYFTASAGVLAMLDPEWAKNYGAMAKMVAMEYANWHRPALQGDAARLPYFRTFEFWTGHSYAGGTADSRGNNEESTSEALQSWLGIALLGEALHDPDMTSAGMMGYTMESRAVQYQWFDAKKEFFKAPGAGYDRSNVAINYDDSKGYGTFFGANPEWILGIETLPIWPGLDFLGQYPDEARESTALMLKQRAVFDKNPNDSTFASMDNNGNNANDWLDILIAYESFYDPQSAAAEFQRMIDQRTGSGTAGSAGLFYYTVHGFRTYGLRDWSLHLSVPLGAVYLKGETGVRTAVAYNSSDAAMDVKVIDKRGRAVATFNAQPRELAVVILSAVK